VIPIPPRTPKNSGHFAIVGIEGFDNIIQNGVDHMLVKSAFVPIRPKVQLERFRFNDLLVRHIFHFDRGKIGLAGGRTDAGEFIGFEFDQIITIRVVIGKGFQLFAGVGTCGLKEISFLDLRVWWA